MANFPLSQGVRDNISSYVLNLAWRPVNLAAQDFPFSVAQLQRIGLELTDPQLNILIQLKEQGLTVIGQFSIIHLALSRERLPQLRRSMTVNIQLPRQVFTGRTPDRHAPMVPRFDNFTPNQRDELCAWMEKLLHQYRLREVVEQLMRALFQHDYKGEIMPTVGHVMALWPMLGTMVDVGTAQRWGRFKAADARLWVERFRNPPVRMANYRPDPALFARYQDLIKVADMHLNLARMLPDIKLDNNRPKVSIEDWERLPGDLKFPL